MPRETRKVKQRRDAAEEVCWSLLLMMQLGGLDISHSWRRYIAHDMQPWVDLAAETGVMAEGGDPVQDTYAELVERVRKLERSSNGAIAPNAGTNENGGDG